MAVKKTKVTQSKTTKQKTTKASLGIKKTSKPLVAQKTVVKGPSAEVFDIRGRKLKQIALPKEIFGQKPNERLLAQAVRVYFNNSTIYAAHTKTRAEVRGGGAKPWRQKGTGRARAGSRRSPLWVGGGKALGPRYREVKLSLPKKMRKAALTHALSSKLQSGSIKVIQNIEKISPKTKVIAGLLNKFQTKGSTLIVISGKNQNVKLASRNIPEVSLKSASDLNAYEVTRGNTIIFSLEAINKLSTQKETTQKEQPR